MLKIGEDDDDPAMAEAELQKLQRQYRVAEGNRKAYTDEAQNTIRKQQAQLKKLTKDNSEYKRELRLLHSVKSDSASADTAVQDLIAQQHGYQEEIVAEMQRLGALQKDIRAAEKELKERRQKMGGSRGQQAKSNAIQRKILTLESRVQVALNKYSQQLTENGSLRETIDHLKAERKMFDSLHKKLEKELQEQKIKMAQVMEMSHQAYEARDEAQNKIAALKEKSEKELQTYTTEVKDLNRFLAHDKKLKDFLGVKSQVRAQDELSATQRAKATQNERPEDQVRKYEAAFERIKEATGIQETEKLVDKFIEGEDQIFSLFTYVNELNSDIEKLQEQNSEVQRNISEFNDEGESVDKMRKSTLEALEERLKTIEGQTATFEDKYASVTNQMDTLKSGIKSLFHKIGCDKSGLLDMLGNSEVSEANIMQFLGSVEQRANELLQLRVLLDHREKEEWESKEEKLREQLEDDQGFDASTTLGPKPKVGGLLGTGPRQLASALTIVPPSTGMEFDSEDSDGEDSLRPLTHDEMKQKLVMKMRKKTKKPTTSDDQ